MASDNERLRADREKANQRLVAAGLEAVSSAGKRIIGSTSTSGLSVKSVVSDKPQIRRAQSDREEMLALSASTSASTLPIGSDDHPPPSSSMSSLQHSVEVTVPSPAKQPSIPQASLLPSAMPQRKLSRESRMVFPPEVSSYMTLADSPRRLVHNASPAGSAQGQLLDAPHITDSPAASFDSSVPSAETNAGYTVPTQTVDLSDEPEPAQPPPPRGSSIGPSVERPLAFPEPVSHPLSSSTAARYNPPPAMSTSQFRSYPGTPNASESQPSFFSSDSVPTSLQQPPPAYASNSVLPPPEKLSQQPPRMTLALLPHARVTIPTSTVTPNPSGRDVLCFIVAITIRSPSTPPQSWSTSKLFSSFLDLDLAIHAHNPKVPRKDWKNMLAPLPDGKAWRDFAPSKIDQRKTALETYLQSVLAAPFNDKRALCDFLTSNLVTQETSCGRKEGYLTKKGKHFGSWKSRFFVLDGPVMEYYESRGGAHLGSIVISNAQIGRQTRPSESSDDRDFRHAFLIIEQLKKGTQRHVLCAESDMDRDSWIEELVKQVDTDTALRPVPSVAESSTSVEKSDRPQQSRSASNASVPQSESREATRKYSKDDFVVTAAQPLSNTGGNEGEKFGGAPSPSLFNQMEQQRATAPQSTSSTAGIKTPRSPIKAMFPGRQSSGTAQQSLMASTATPANMRNAPPPSYDPPMAASKRQSAVPSKTSHSAAYLSKLSAEGLSAPPGQAPLDPKDRERKAKSGRFWPSFASSKPSAPAPQAPLVFGVPIADSIAVASVANLPAIVFRCIQWLEVNHAEQEEGIYRLSGSSAVIKGLKDRFNAEGDVDLVRLDERWDPHAIAGLLKTFLRDLPNSLLTHQLHSQFLAVMDLVDSSARVAELSRLVAELPPPNYALLRALTAHLILIVSHAQANKMTLRNVGIVFSPTLGIPAGIFSDLVNHFGRVFDDAPESPGPEDVEAASSVHGVSQRQELGVLEEEDEEPGTLSRNRNSRLYAAGGVDTLLGLGGRSLDPRE